MISEPIVSNSGPAKADELLSSGPTMPSRHHFRITHHQVLAALVVQFRKTHIACESSRVRDILGLRHEGVSASIAVGRIMLELMDAGLAERVWLGRKETRYRPTEKGMGLHESPSPWKKVQDLTRPKSMMTVQLESVQSSPNLELLRILVRCKAKAEILAIMSESIANSPRSILDIQQVIKDRGAGAVCDISSIRPLMVKLHELGLVVRSGGDRVFGFHWTMSDRLLALQNDPCFVSIMEQARTRISHGPRIPPAKTEASPATLTNQTHPDAPLTPILVE